MSDNRGISCLGLCHPKFPLKQLIACWKSLPALRGRHLDNFFNPKHSKKFAKVLQQEQRKHWTVAVINGPGMNNAVTQPHEITYKETTASVDKKVREGNKRFLNAYEGRLKHVHQVIAKNNSGALALSINPWLEHMTVSKQAFDKLANIALQFFPDALIIDNPRGGSPYIPGNKYAKEEHGSHAPKNIRFADLDGEDWEGVDLLAYGTRFANTTSCFIWGPECNGRDPKAPAGGFLPPEKRAAWPLSRDFATYRAWILPDALTPAPGPSAQDLAGKQRHDPRDGVKQDFVWKLGDGKNYAIVLFPKAFNYTRFKSVKIVKDGKTLDTAKYRYNYTEDGSNRQVWDFSKHITAFPKNCVLHADGHAWVLDFAQFRID